MLFWTGVLLFIAGDVMMVIGKNLSRLDKAGFITNFVGWSAIFVPYLPQRGVRYYYPPWPGIPHRVLVMFIAFVTLMVNMFFMT